MRKEVWSAIRKDITVNGTETQPGALLKDIEEITEIPGFKFTLALMAPGFQGAECEQICILTNVECSSSTDEDIAEFVAKISNYALQPYLPKNLGFDFTDNNFLDHHFECEYFYFDEKETEGQNFLGISITDLSASTVEEEIRDMSGKEELVLFSADTAGNSARIGKKTALL